MTRGDVAAAAAQLADAEGLQAVTLIGVAELLKMRSPSLYAHVDGLQGLRSLVALQAARGLVAALRAAKGSNFGIEAFRAEAHGYRRYALDHPGLYEALQLDARPGLDRELYSVLKTLGSMTDRSLSEAGIRWGERVHLSRMFRASLHGFALLERDHTFGSDSSLDESFARLVDALVASARAAAAAV